MKHVNVRKWGLALPLLFSLFLSTSAVAGKPLITSSFSGIWDQPEQTSQGIILQIGEQAEDKKVGIAYWFTYGPDRQTAWYLGVGPVRGNKIRMKLYTATDVGFMAKNLKGDDSVEPVGTMDLVFRNCNHGYARYAFDAVEGDLVTEPMAGEFPIKRISSIYRQRCSGGISDDTPRHGKPMDLDVGLYPVSDSARGRGKAMFWERTDRTDFKVAVENIPDGVYTLEICGGTEEVVLFELPVAEGVGKLEFRSPEADDKLNLNFDPRDCKIELLDGEVVVLSSGDEVLSEKKNGN